METDLSYYIISTIWLDNATDIGIPLISSLLKFLPKNNLQTTSPVIF